MLAMMTKKFVFFLKTDINLQNQIGVDLILANRLEENFFDTSTLAS